ncbi:hypothetical protein AVEN_49151-1 [Araneus ventricosus]|uniref:Uncharacterized protein n=1 Tax=Araneus ventricosus TaxID=182803 RepID=A0A4Y2C0N5_ARAVE|nr:hypothetical protein AVEN_49151-1 [Araneus ventricosus]
MVVTKVAMTRVGPFGKVAERFASQQETSFSVTFLVRFPQAFITTLFQAFQKIVKTLPLADKIKPIHPSEALLLQRGQRPFFTPSSKPYFYKLQIPPSWGSNRVHRIGRQTH